MGKGRDADRIKREGGDAAKRAERRARTASIDAALALTAAWFVDLIAFAEGARGLVRNVDRTAALAEGAADLDPALAQRAAELAMETRRHLTVNVQEELALEALFTGSPRCSPRTERSPPARRTGGQARFSRPSVLGFGPPVALQLMWRCRP